MAKHIFEYVEPQGPVDFGKDPKRKCIYCDQIQHRETQTNWMRVTGYRWMPLLGRCPGPKGENNVVVDAD